IPASITVNGTGSGTFGMSLDIIPPLGEVLTKTQGPVFLMGPSGTTFSPNLTMVIDYSLMTSSVTTIEALAAGGYLQLKRCDAAGANCENIAFTINTETKKLTFSTDHFSTFAMYDGTPSGSTGGNTGSGSGGGSFAGKTLPPASKVEQVTPTPAPVEPTKPEETITPAKTPTEPTTPEVTPTEKTAVEEAPAQIEQPTPSPDNGIWSLVAAAGVAGVGASLVILVIIAGAAWYAFKGKKGKN
ncbi:MAG: hypothetical protein V1728_06255, partial [Candidatus Micrarchaeota archaeon]